MKGFSRARWFLSLFGMAAGLLLLGTVAGAASPSDASPASAPAVSPSSAPAVSPSSASSVSPSTAPAVSPSSTPQMTLSREAALKMALDQNTGLIVAERQEKEAWWAYKLAGKAPNLTLSFNYTGGTTLNNYLGLTQDTYLQALETFQPFGNTAAQARAAFHAYEMAHATTLQTRVTLIQNVKDAFIGLLVAQEQRQVAIENLKLADGLYTLTKQKLEAGAGPRMDVLNMEIQRASAVQALTSAEGTLKQAQAALVPLLQLPRGQAVEASGTCELPDEKVVLTDLLAAAEASHPSILLARKTLEQSKEQVKVARTQANPTVSLGYIYDTSSFTHTPPIYAGMASISIPIDWGQILFGVRQARETVKEKETALSGAQTTVLGNVKSAFAGYEAALANATTFKSTVLVPSEKLLVMTRLGYGQGALNFIVLLNAEQTLRNARIQYLGLLQSGHQALDALEAAVGKALDEVRPSPH